MCLFQILWGYVSAKNWQIGWHLTKRKLKGSRSVLRHSLVKSWYKRNCDSKPRKTFRAHPVQNFASNFHWACSKNVWFTSASKLIGITLVLNVLENISFIILNETNDNDRTTDNGHWLVVEKAHDAPQAPWSMGGWIQPGQCSRASNSTRRWCSCLELTVKRSAERRDVGRRLPSRCALSSSTLKPPNCAYFTARHLHSRTGTVPRHPRRHHHYHYVIIIIIIIISRRRRFVVVITYVTLYRQRRRGLKK